MNEIVIVAPHPDDELIGCYTVFQKEKVKEVIYLFDLTEERKKEASRLADKLGFKPIFNISLELREMTADAIYIPSIADIHPHHKQAHYWALQNFTGGRLIYYTVDKNIPIEVLSIEDQWKKRLMLDNFYPSQKKLWVRDDKYILFEGFREIDADIWAKVQTTFEGYHRWENAPNEVDFLRSRHRHIFHVTVWIEQRYTARDVEFILFKQAVNKFLTKWKEITSDLWSCEDLANSLRITLMKDYKRRVRVQVMEDNENGALLE